MDRITGEWVPEDAILGGRTRVGEVVYDRGGLDSCEGEAALPRAGVVLACGIGDPRAPTMQAFGGVTIWARAGDAVSSIAITISVLSPLKLNSSKFSLDVSFVALQGGSMIDDGVLIIEGIVRRMTTRYLI